MEARRRSSRRQPLGGEPVVDGAAHRRRQILAEHRRRAVQHVADGIARAERIQCLGAQQIGIGAGVALRGLPVGSDVDRRIRRKGGRGVVVTLQPAHQYVRAPVLVEIGNERPHAGQGRMDVAIDRARRGNGHKAKLRVISRIGPHGRGFNGGGFTVVSCVRSTVTLTRPKIVIPAKHVPVEAGSGNPELIPSPGSTEPAA